MAKAEKLCDDDDVCCEKKDVTPLDAIALLCAYPVVMIHAIVLSKFLCNFLIHRNNLGG